VFFNLNYIWQDATNVNGCSGGTDSRIVHLRQFGWILREIFEVRISAMLSAMAAHREYTMLLPYGIQIAIGSLTYFLWAPMLP
jgi:hypothetical protein